MTSGWRAYTASSEYGCLSRGIGCIACSRRVYNGSSVTGIISKRKAGCLSIGTAMNLHGVYLRPHIGGVDLSYTISSAAW